MTAKSTKRKSRARDKNSLCICGCTFQEHSYGRRKCDAPRGKFTPKKGK